jgi:hypothetical protein
MKKLLFSLLAAASLSACTTNQIDRGCALGQVAGLTLSQILANLQAAGVVGELATKLANALFLGEATRASVCAVLQTLPPSAQ